MNRLRMISRFLLALLIAGCAHSKKEITFTENTQKITEVEAPETPPVVPLNPRTIEAELKIRISNIRVLSGKKLKQDNRKRGIPELSAPQVHIWSSAIVQRPNQTVLDLDLDGPAPSDIFVDDENGNQIFYWNLTEALANRDSIVIRRRVKIESYELFSIVDLDNIPPYDSYDEGFQANTKSERFLELTPEIRAAAEDIVGVEQNPYHKAKLIHQWVNASMSFKYPPGKRGASAALRKLKGDSGQFVDLFVALCRAAGIPTRVVSGFRFNENEKLKNQVWAEFYLPDHGWIPADPMKDASTFGRLDNRLAVSVGRNIQLKHVPHWATFSNSEVEDDRTGHMQLATIAFSGIRARFKTSIKTIKFEEPKLFTTEDEQ
jgi:hypothetical protein